MWESICGKFEAETAPVGPYWRETLSGRISVFWLKFETWDLVLKKERYRIPRKFQ
jgi:hypothetical protein